MDRYQKRINLMHYMGGKFRQSKAIAAALVKLHTNEKTYVEPFCGSLGAAEKCIPALASRGIKNFIMSDANAAVIKFWKASFSGWKPPLSVSEDEYQHCKSAQDLEDPLTAYCGHAISFGGKWFGGYARGANLMATKQKHSAARNSCLRKVSVLKPFNISFKCLNYNETNDHNNTIMYLDPPYIGRCKAHKFSGFNHDEFWEWAEKQSVNNSVIVTEFIAPNNWVSVHSWGDTVVRHLNAKSPDGTNEQIFVLDSKASAFNG